MKFFCKKCDSKFDEDYNNLFEHIKCPNCKKNDIVLNFIVQGVHPPEAGLGISYLEFEDALEEGKIKYLEQFFDEEFDLKYTRSKDEFSLSDTAGEAANLEQIYQKTQKDGKLQRIIYNIFYLLLQEG